MIDLQKYKRFFTFGCSFTNYIWPTWADVLAAEMPDTLFYNFGYSGSGNLAIASKIVEADLRFKFDENDLIIVMWSTWCREDRYVNGAWLQTGNIFSDRGISCYGKEFVGKYADPTGYLLRDLAIISMTQSYLERATSTSKLLFAVPFFHQIPRIDSTVQELCNLYRELIHQYPLSLFKSEMKGNWGISHSYYNNGFVDDTHPTPDRYFQYLSKLGFPLTEVSREYSNNATMKLKNTKNIQEILEAFPMKKKYLF